MGFFDGIYGIGRMGRGGERILCAEFACPSNSWISSRLNLFFGMDVETMSEDEECVARGRARTR